MKILSVDDKAENLYLLKAILNGAGSGYEVVSAHNGVEALQKLGQERFDLIISDILMPQMDGFELCHQVKGREDLHHIPFIFYTATYTEKKDQELGLRLGASRFIIKPAEPENFLASLREVIKEHEAGRLLAPKPVEKEESLLNEYSRRLVRKLDKKVQDLEQLTQKLEATLKEKEGEVVERRRAEEEIRRLNTGLEERVRERTAELAATNKDLENFVSAVSHDLRAPLRAINGFTQVLAESCADKLDSLGATCLEKVQSEAHRMGELIEALLLLSRAARAELSRQQVDLSQMAADIGAEMHRAEPQRTVELIVTPGLVAQGDPALLRAALRNLLANAWKFTSKSPQARIEFGRMEHGGKPTYFVRDNGIGFAMADSPKLFAPFQRLHHAADYPGTGIGLATVQRIVRRHGGDVCAEGAVGKGAVFYFTLQ